MGNPKKRPSFLFPISKNRQFIFTRGNGSRLETVSGRTFLDFGAGYAASSLGYGNHVASRAVSKGALELMHSCSCDFPNPHYIELAYTLHEVANPFITEPGIYIGISGSEVVEAAIKLLALQRKVGHIIAFENSFHGRSLGAMSIGSYHALGKSKYLSVPVPVHFLSFPSNSEEMVKTVEFLENFGVSNDILAIIVEPILGEGGYLFPPDGFLKKLRTYATEKQCFLVFDEIQTGVGRTGSFFSFENFGVAPDAVLLAKGLASGMPVGALIFSLATFDITGWDHAGTFSGNPLSCAAAVETIHKILQPGFLSGVCKRGQLTLETLTAMANRYPNLFMNPRGLGLMLAFDLNASSLFIEMFIRNALENGLILLRTGSTGVRISPPLTISEEDLQLGCQIIEESLLATQADVRPNAIDCLYHIHTKEKLIQHTGRLQSEYPPAVSSENGQEKTLVQVFQSQQPHLIDWDQPFTSENQTKILVESRFRAASWAVIAIHGGDLEFRTDDLARVVAGENYGYHIFSLKRKTWQEARPIGHVPSTSYEHPDLSRLLALSNKLLSLHACQFESHRLESLRKLNSSCRRAIFLGGCNHPYLRKKMSVFLKQAFRETAPDILILDKPEYEDLFPELSGHNPDNVVNRFGIPGIQLEIENDLLKSEYFSLIAQSLRQFIQEHSDD